MHISWNIYVWNPLEGSQYRIASLLNFLNFQNRLITKLSLLFPAHFQFYCSERNGGSIRTVPHSDVRPWIWVLFSVTDHVITSMRGIIINSCVPSQLYMTHVCITHAYWVSLQWRHNGRDGVSYHQPHHCLLKHLFRRRSKKTLKLRVTGFCAGNSPVTGEFPAHRTSNAENVSIRWRHDVWPVFDALKYCNVFGL